MTNKERLDLSNEQIERITKTLAKKQVSPNDMLQQMVDQNNSCENLFYYWQGTSVDFIKGLDTSKVTNMKGMFYNCSYLTSLDLRSFNTSEVTNMMKMFENCSRLTSLDVSSFDTSKVTNMSNMFGGLNSLTEINLRNFDTSNVINFEYLFSYSKGFKNLDLSYLNTSKVTSMQYAFSNCSNLETLNISGWDTSKITKFYQMFNECTALREILGEINLINVTNINYPFNKCVNLTNVTLKNIKVALQLGSGTSWGTLLSDESLINTFKELWDLTGTSSKTLTLSTPSNARTEQIYVKLVDVTDEMLAQDQYAGNKKPCVVCEPTDEGAMTLKEYGISKNWSIA